MEIHELLAIIEDLKNEIILLKNRLSKYETPKTSRNSSIPPSKDENRPKTNQSLRESSGKKPGGQLGRQGKTLEMTSTPDEIVELFPDYCNSCGFCLEELPATKEQSRQIIDIPPVKAVYTEYQTFSKVCRCGCQTTANFPMQVNGPISYGATVESLIGYFHARQYIPFARMQEIFNDVFKINISEGGIKQRVTTSQVVGADETGVKVNGDKHWFWTWQTDNLTYITHSENRKFEVHDGWRPQMSTLAENHQNCLPHLLRRLNYLNERYPKSSWGVDFRKLLYKAIALKKKMTAQDYKNNTERSSIIRALEELLNQPPDTLQKELYSFFKRMKRERQTLFVFLFIEQVPADNNASERAIRNVKVKQKISGQFKKVQAAQNFAQIRSVIDTTFKNGMNCIEALNLIAKFQFQFNTD